MVRNCLKTLDSGFCRNDGKWYFLTFYEIINFESFIKNNSKYSSKTIQIIAGLNSYNIILYPRYRWDYIISGVVLIAESHISIHTFPSKQFLSIDIFSCKKFDSKDSICFVEDIFDLKKIEVNLLDRGLEFPKDIRLATDIVYKERLNPAG
jgi:S-adenosylmethionine decarboxylase